MWSRNKGIDGFWMAARIARQGGVKNVFRLPLSLSGIEMCTITSHSHTHTNLSMRLVDLN